MPGTLEDPQLDVAVALERPVAVEVGGLEGQEHGDLELQLVDVLELEGRELADDPRVVRRLHARQRTPDVAGDRDRASGGTEDRAEELHGRRLAVRPGDADERAGAQRAVAELD